MLSIIVPCYNESEGVNQLRERLMPVIKNLEKTQQVQLIFVDDGSTDNTNELLHKTFSEKFVKIIKHEKNMNLGAAVRTGFLAADGDVIVTMDSDCTYAPEEIPKLLDELKDCDIVTASPLCPGGKIIGVPAYRRFLSWGATTLYSVITQKRIYTWAALFRAYRRDAISDIVIENNNFTAVVEILVKAIKNGKRVKEMPAELTVRKYGMSKIKLASTILAHIKFLTQTARIMYFSK